MAEGDLGSGANRSGGEKGGDAFTRRERGSEDMYIKQEERNKLQLLKEKLQKQQEHIEQIKNNIDDIVRQSGGEHN